MKLPTFPVNHKCPDDSLRIVDKKEVYCTNCSDYECYEGLGMNVKCDTDIAINAFVGCIKCTEDETYSSKIGFETCQPCQKTKCLKNQAFGGVCTTRKDTTFCRSHCVPGFVMNSNKTECLPIHPSSWTGVPSIRSTKNEGFGLIGHPALFSFLVFAVIVLAASWIIYLVYKKFHKQSDTDVEHGSPHCVETAQANELTNPSSITSVCSADDQPLVTTCTDEESCSPSNFTEAMHSLGETPPGPTSPQLSHPEEEGCFPLLPVQSDEDDSACNVESSQTDAGSSTIGGLNANDYIKICTKLNQKIPEKDWQKLAGLMEYSIDDVKRFGNYDDPTDAVLQDWKTVAGNNLAKLVVILKVMGRDDVVKIIEKAATVSPLHK